MFQNLSGPTKATSEMSAYPMSTANQIKSECYSISDHFRARSKSWRYFGQSEALIGLLKTNNYPGTTGKAGIIASDTTTKH